MGTRGYQGLQDHRGRLVTQDQLACQDLMAPPENQASKALLDRQDHLDSPETQGRMGRMDCLERRAARARKDPLVLPGLLVTPDLLVRLGRLETKG